MATVPEKKAACGYTPKLIPDTCSNCAHFAFDRVLPEWMQRWNADAMKLPYTVGAHGIEKNCRCTLHGFAVKKTGACSEHMPAAMEGGAA